MVKAQADHNIISRGGDGKLEKHQERNNFFRW